MKKLIPILFLFMAFTSNAQLMNQKGTFLISTNPLKWIYGIPNFEVEYYLSSSFSVEFCSEYVLSNWVIKSEDHPDFVSRFGFRYHILHAKESGGKNDPYIGLFGGNSWSKDFPQHTTMNFGVDFGYKFQFNDYVFINAKGLVTYKTKDSKVLPGFECLFGYIF